MRLETEEWWNARMVCPQCQRVRWMVFQPETEVVCPRCQQPMTPGTHDAVSRPALIRRLGLLRDDIRDEL